MGYISTGVYCVVLIFIASMCLFGLDDYRRSVPDRKTCILTMTVLITTLLFHIALPVCIHYNL